MNRKDKAMQLGLILANMRRNLNYSLTEIAQHVGKSQSWLSRVERPPSDYISRESAKALLKVYGVDCGILDPYLDVCVETKVVFSKPIKLFMKKCHTKVEYVSDKPAIEQLNCDMEALDIRIGVLIKAHETNTRKQINALKKELKELKEKQLTEAPLCDESPDVKIGKLEFKVKDMGDRLSRLWGMVHYPE